MNGRIPKKAADCVICWQQDHPCEYHANGDYDGPDLYHPSEWVQSVVGKRYTFVDFTNYGGIGSERLTHLRVCTATGYDPRGGFFIEADTSDGLPAYVSNISERAIDRTFRRVRMTLGAVNLLQATKDEGEVPEDHPNIQYGALDTLIRYGALTRAGEITDVGEKILQADPVTCCF
jgi:hypothetical protein